MPFHRATQRNRVRPPDDGIHTIADQMSDGELAVMQYIGVERLWYIDSGDNKGWWVRRDVVTSGGMTQERYPLGNADHYDPYHRIRGMSVSGADDDLDGRMVEFDLPMATRALDRFIFGATARLWVTRVYLKDVAAGLGENNQTTATDINLYF